MRAVSNVRRHLQPVQQALQLRLSFLIIMHKTRLAMDKKPCKSMKHRGTAFFAKSLCRPTPPQTGKCMRPLAGKRLLPYGAPMRRRFVTGVAPGLQNRWQALRSVVGSTPIRLRQPNFYFVVPYCAAGVHVCPGFAGVFLFLPLGTRGASLLQLAPVQSYFSDFFLWLERRCSRMGACVIPNILRRARSRYRV